MLRVVIRRDNRTMICFDASERVPFLDGEKAKILQKSEFSVGLKEEYNNDFVEFSRGVDVLSELTENGLITEEEEARRIFLLENYLNYQRRSNLLREISCSHICCICAESLHHWWDYCIRWVYYTDTD